MDYSRKSQIIKEEYEDVKPSLLPQQHPSPPSFSVPSLMHTPTFPAPMIHQTLTKTPFFLQIPNGCDVIGCVTQFAQSYQLPVTVLSGQGLVSDVDFMFPQTRTRPKFISGCFQMISFSGTYCFNAVSGDIMSSFNVLLAGPQGAFVGGLVASTMKAASPVTLICITNNLS
ncbi:hypothetical protein AgCh_001586 [Apium graveolens]